MTARQGPKRGFGPAFIRRGECHVWNRSVDKDGYGYFRRGGKIVLAHVHYYEQKHGPIPAGHELDHTCRNRACVNPDHLQAVTHLENVRRSRTASVLTMERARHVRALRQQGLKYREIAEQVGISVSHVTQVVTNRIWREVANAEGGAA